MNMPSRMSQLNKRGYPIQKGYKRNTFKAKGLPDLSQSKASETLAIVTHKSLCVHPSCTEPELYWQLLHSSIIRLHYGMADKDKANKPSIDLATKFKAYKQ
jgi:hypothetical protein